MNAPKGTNRAASVVVGRAIGWMLFAAPIALVISMWLRYARSCNWSPLDALLISCQTLSGPLAWVTCGAQYDSHSRWIYCVLAGICVGCYSYVIIRVPCSLRWAALHLLVATCWCGIGLLWTGSHAT